VIVLLLISFVLFLWLLFILVKFKNVRYMTYMWVVKRNTDIYSSGRIDVSARINVPAYPKVPT
jgi:hypothetical protein